MCPRKSYYASHKKELIEKQKIKRRQKQENVKRALAELERLEKEKEQKLDRDVFESQAVKNLIKKQLIEDGTEDEEKIEGSNPWK